MSDSLWAPIGIAFLVVFGVIIPLLGAIREWRRSWASHVAERRAHELELERRRIAPGTLTLRGRVDPPVTIEIARAHGCLGGPIIYRVPPFDLVTHHGRVAIDPGSRVFLEGEHVLEPLPAREGEGDGPITTGAPDLRWLAGEVEVVGVVSTPNGHAAPPDGAVHVRIAQG